MAGWKQSTRYGLVGIAALALLSCVHWIRGLSGELVPAVAYLVGVLPNVVAAIAIPFVFMGIIADQKKDAPPTTIQRWFYASVITSCFGLLGWELIQRTSDRLIFDFNDLLATVVGSMIACAIFLAITPTTLQNDET